MKNKISRILGVVLSLTLVLGTLLPATPVAAAPGDTQWYRESLPSGSTTTFTLKSGASINDIAVADASTVYVINGAQAAAAIQTTNTVAVAGGTYNVTYINELGVTGRVSANFVIPASAIGASVAIVLQGADAGVLEVTGVAVVAAGAAADAFSINDVATGTVFGNVTNGATGAFSPAAVGRVFKSTDAGQSFTNLTTYSGGRPIAIAVASDDVNAIAVTDGIAVYVSNDAGTTWSTLPAFNLAGVALDVAVCPKRSGTLLGREYAVALSDPGAGAVALGDVEIIGATATWTTVGSAASPVAATFDFTSVVASPNFLGDRCVVALGTRVGATTVATTDLLIVNTATNTIVQDTPLVAAGANSTTINFSGAAGANSIRLSSISLPTNFDPTTAAGRRSFVGITSVAPTTDNDVYRVDDNSARALGAVTSQPIASVAYVGTIDAGTLLMGRAGTTDVRFTTNAQTTSPTWTTTTKAPNGFAGPGLRTIVRTAADFATTNRVFAGTTLAAVIGENNGLFISNDGGVSFDGECFLNTVANTLVTIQGIALTPDGATIFLVSDDGANIMLWKCATPVSGSKWSRIFCVAGAQGMVKLNPAYTTTPAVYFTDVGVAAGNMYASQNSGATFATRMVPAGVTPSVYALQDAQTVYMVDNVGNGNMYKSTNGGWTWSTAIGSKQTGVARSMIVPKADWVVIGGTSGASYSKDGGASFSSINTGLSGGGNIYVVADEKFDTNGFVYASAATAASVNRYVLDVSSSVTKSTQWDIINNAATAGQIGVGFANGVLYAMGGIGCDRTLNPQDVAGTLEWSLMDTTATTRPVAAAFVATAGTSSGNVIYAADTTAGALLLCSYSDWLAVTKPDLLTPANDFAVSIDPVTGRSDVTDLKWKTMGTGTGAVNRVDVDVAFKADGFITGAPSNPNEPVNPTAPFFTFTNLRANTDYIWRVRASNTVSGDAIMSQWSDVRTLKVQSGGMVQQPYAGPVLLGPAGGAQDVNPTLVGFSWAPVSGATEYTVIVATDAALTQTIASTPAKIASPAYQATGLEYGTTYFWSVQATKPTVGTQAIGTFTTMAKPAPQVTTAPPTQAPPTIVMPQPETPPYVWAVIAIGAILIIAVIILIVRTRRVP